MNVSATLNAFRLLRSPSLCLPHATISTFNDLPVPLSNAFGNVKADIRAVVLDKDNCFAVPKKNVVYKPYMVGHACLTFQRLFPHQMSLRTRLLFILSFVPVHCVGHHNQIPVKFYTLSTSQDAVGFRYQYLRIYRTNSTLSSSTTHHHISSSSQTPLVPPLLTPLVRTLPASHPPPVFLSSSTRRKNPGVAPKSCNISSRLRAPA